MLLKLEIGWGGGLFSPGIDTNQGEKEPLGCPNKTKNNKSFFIYMYRRFKKARIT